MRKVKKSGLSGRISGWLLASALIVSMVMPATTKAAAAAIGVDTSTGLVTSARSISDSNYKTVVYCSPNASSGGSGTSNSPMTLQAALTLSKTKEGIAILLQSGTYSFSSELIIAYGNNGTAQAYKVLKAAEGAYVTLDFSSQAYSTGARGLKIDGNYWYIYGITVKGAADNGIYLSGNNNVLERCILQGNRDSGLQISRRDSSLTSKADWPSNNYIINCTAFDNDDPATHENADGFASKLTCGEGNVFDGCISYCNIDDGWDLFAKPETGSIGVVTIRNCIAFHNGSKTDGTTSTNGDRNGFKLGGSSGACPTPHIVYNSMAINNGADGFTDNGNGAALQIYNCTSYDNAGGNFTFDRTKGGIFANLLSVSGNSSDKFVGTIENSVYYNSSKYYNIQALTSVTSGVKVGTAISAPAASNFVSMSLPSVSSDIDTLWRNSDGTIKTNGLLVKSGSSFSEMGGEFGNNTNTLGVHVSTGSQTVPVTTSADTSATQAATIASTTASSTATTTSSTSSSTGTTKAEVHSAAQVVDSGSIVKAEAVTDIIKAAVGEPIVSVVANSATILDSSVFSVIAGKDKIVKVDIANAENQIIYSWSFDGKLINSSDIAEGMSVDLSISFDADQSKKQAIEKEYKKRQTFYLTFTQHGNLPGPAQIKAYVGNVYSDGSELILYYYNDDTGKIDLIKDSGFVVTNGYVEFSISHCSTYFFVKKETATSSTAILGQNDVISANSSDASGDNGNGMITVIVIILAVVAIAIGVLVFMIRKRKNALASESGSTELENEFEIKVDNDKKEE